MILIRPIAITTANLESSNIPENDAPTWSGSTTYALRQQVLWQHRVYESLGDGNLNHQPDEGAVSEPPTWLDLGPANRLRMFDSSPSTTSQRAGSIQFVVVPGKAVNAVGLINLTAQTVTVEVLDVGGTAVWSQTKSLLDTDPLGSGDADYLTDVVFLTLLVSALRLRVTIDAGTGTAKCGACLIGRQALLGDTLFGSNIGIRDYSRKETDEFGETRVVKRGYSKTGDFPVVLNTERLSAVQRQLAAVRAEPVLYVGVSYRNETILYGFYRSFSLLIAAPIRTTISIEVESLTYEGDDALFPDATVSTPALTSPAAEATIPPNGSLASSAFATSPTGVDVHQKSDWQIASNSGFTTIVHQSLDDTVNKTAYTVPSGALASSGSYYARVRHYGAGLGASQWSAGVHFSTSAPAGSVNAPSVTAPASNGESRNIGLPITSSAFATTGGSDTHVSSDWQIASDAAFTIVVVQSLGDSANKTSWTPPAGSINAGSTYYVRVRHRGASFGDSPFSATRQFVAADPWDKLGNSYGVRSTHPASCVSVITVQFRSNGYWSVDLGASGTSIDRQKNGSAFGASDSGQWIKGAFVASQYEISMALTSGDSGTTGDVGTGGFVSLASTRSFSIKAESSIDDSAFCSLQVRIREVAVPANEMVKNVSLSTVAVSTL